MSKSTAFTSSASFLVNASTHSLFRPVNVQRSIPQCDVVFIDARPFEFGLVSPILFFLHLGLTVFIDQLLFQHIECVSIFVVEKKQDHGDCSLRRVVIVGDLRKQMRVFQLYRDPTRALVFNNVSFGTVNLAQQIDTIANSDGTESLWINIV